MNISSYSFTREIRLKLLYSSCEELNSYMHKLIIHSRKKKILSIVTHHPPRIKKKKKNFQSIQSSPSQYHPLDSFLQIKLETLPKTLEPSNNRHLPHQKEYQFLSNNARIAASTPHSFSSLSLSLSKAMSLPREILQA